MNPELIQGLQDLPHIPEECARAYQEQTLFLVEQVNKKMTSRKDCNLLIGHNTLGKMFDNHKNHAAFMANVFLFRCYELLLTVIPWVYRSYHNQGFAYGYFPAHLQAWKQVLAEHLPDHISAPIIQVYEWIISRHETFITLSEDIVFLNLQIETQDEQIVQRFSRALLQGDRNSSLEISREFVSSAQDLQDFYLRIVQPAMYMIGEMWEKGEISVAKEHLASATVNRILALQYLEFMTGVAPSMSRVVVSTAANEYHEMGAQMVANALELDGWDVQYLGANTPNQDLLELIQEKQPFILAMSVAMPFNLEPVHNVITQILSQAAEKRPRIMLGGLAFHNLPDLPLALGADGYARDCRQALSLARQWHEKYVG